MNYSLSFVCWFGAFAMIVGIFIGLIAGSIRKHE